MTEQEIALIAQLQAILEAAKTTTPITPGDPITKALLFFDTFPNLTLCYFDAVEKIDEIPTADRIFFKALANRIRPEVSSKLMPISLTETLGKNGNLGLHIHKLALQISLFDEKNLRRIFAWIRKSKTGIPEHLINFCLSLVEPNTVPVKIKHLVPALIVGDYLERHPRFAVSYFRTLENTDAYFDTLAKNANLKQQNDVNLQNIGTNPELRFIIFMIAIRELEAGHDLTIVFKTPGREIPKGIITLCLDLGTKNLRVLEQTLTKIEITFSKTEKPKEQQEYLSDIFTEVKETTHKKKIVDLFFKIAKSTKSSDKRSIYGKLLSQDLENVQLQNKLHDALQNSFFLKLILTQHNTNSLLSSNAETTYSTQLNSFLHEKSRSKSYPHLEVDLDDFVVPEDDIVVCFFRYVSNEYMHNPRIMTNPEIPVNQILTSVLSIPNYIPEDLKEFQRKIDILLSQYANSDANHTEQSCSRIVSLCRKFDEFDTSAFIKLMESKHIYLSTTASLVMQAGSHNTNGGSEIDHAENHTNNGLPPNTQFDDSHLEEQVLIAVFEPEKRTSEEKFAI